MEYTKTDKLCSIEISDENLEQVTGGGGTGGNDDAKCPYLKDAQEGRYNTCPEKLSNTSFNFGWRDCDKCPLCK